MFFSTGQGAACSFVMMRLFPTLSVLLSVVLTTFAADPVATAPAKPPLKTVRLLTVGNSFSQNATRDLPGLAQAAGCALIIHRADVGGSPLELHWKKAEDFERDP